MYDLAPYNNILFPLGLGFYHSGVVVHGTEYTFSSSGIYSHPPRNVDGAIFRCSISVGEAHITSSELTKLIDSLRENWSGSEYSLLRKNCNSFSEELIFRLNGKTVPTWLNRMSYIGRNFSCLFPKDFDNNAPVQPDSTDENAYTRQANEGNGGFPNKSDKFLVPFSGSGHKLSNPNTTATSTSSGLLSIDTQQIDSGVSTPKEQHSPATLRQLRAAAAMRRLEAAT